MKESTAYVRSKAGADERGAAAEISKTAVYTVGIVSALIGIWGLACFVGGLVASGGPLAFIGNWFKAVGGM